MTQEQQIKILELESRTCKTENKNLLVNQAYYMDQIADLKKELCMMESQSNMIIFSSKHSTVSPSQTSIADKDDADETMMTEEDDGISGTIHA